MRSWKILLILFSVQLAGCAGKYVIRSFPSDSKVYLKDIRTDEKKLIGNTPVSIPENEKLGDVFFLEFERENYKSKDVMIKVNPGESLTVSAILDPLVPGDTGAKDGSGEAGDKDKPQGGQPEQKPKDWQEEMTELKMRVALLENTTAFYKDAMFSARFSGGPRPQDRDRSETVVGLIFQSQQEISRNNFAKAITTIDKALAIDEFSTHAWMLKGTAEYLKQNFAGARIAWERTLKLEPNNKEAYRFLNQVYRRLKIDPMPEGPETLRAPASDLEIRKRSTR